MLEESFSSGKSIFHKADARVKIIVACLYILTLVLSYDLDRVLILFIFSCFLIPIARISFLKVLKRLIVVNSFVLFLWFFLPFSTPGTPVFHIYKFVATLQGIEQAFLITLKANGAILIIVSFINTTSIPLLGYALDKLKFPPKFVLLFLLTYRYIGVIFEEFNRLMNAAKIRNFILKTNFHTYKTISYMFAMILIRSYERGKRVYNAMLLRGFNGRFYSLQHTRLSKYDVYISFITFFIIAISMFNQYILFFVMKLIQ